MLMLFRRKAIIPVWLVVFWLLALFGSPMTFATGVLVLLMGAAALTIMLVLLPGDLARHTTNVPKIGR